MLYTLGERDTVVCFAVGLCVLQIYQGTAPLFSLCSFLFIIIAY